MADLPAHDRLEPDRRGSSHHRNEGVAAAGRSANGRSGPPAAAAILGLQRSAGNAAAARLLADRSASVQREPASPAPAAAVASPAPEASKASQASEASANGSGAAGDRTAFVREDGLSLRKAPGQTSESIAQLAFGTRVHVLDDEAQHPGWQKVATPSAIGYLAAPRVHSAPPDLIAADPGLQLIKIGSGQTFWGLVKEQYGIQGNENGADQNIDHFINAIRTVNKTDAFIVNTGWLADIANFFVSGRDASETLLKAGYDLWIPSFGYAATMDVGSGTVTGEVAGQVKKIEQKVADFTAAATLAADKYIPAAITSHAGDTALGLLQGLIDFAIDAAKILAGSTAAGALIGAMFGGVGAVPGAEVGFEIGMQILEFYGLAMLVDTIASMSDQLFGQLGGFIGDVWNANGDPKKIDNAAQTLAEALGVLVSAMLMALAAYLTKKGGDALAQSKFGARIGETQLAKWLADRQQLKTTSETLAPKPPAPQESGRTASTSKHVSTGAKTGEDPTSQTIQEGTVRMEDHPDFNTEVAAAQQLGFTIVRDAGDPHVEIRKVVDGAGKQLRIDKVLHIRPGMRYLDFEHEMGHIRQVTDPARFPDGPLPTTVMVEDAKGLREARNQSGTLNTRQNAVLEYHNRLQEVVWLDERKVSPEILREHLDGIDGALGVKGWRQRYQDAIRGGEKSSITQWAREHFPDLGELSAKVAAIRMRVYKGGGESNQGNPGGTTP